MKPVVLLTSGTRGDVQPYLALGLGLQRAGLPVRLVAPREFANLAKKHGLPFEPLEGNPSALMTHSSGQSALTYDGNVLRSLRATRRYMQAVRPVFAAMLTSARQACRDARAIVIGLPCTWGQHIAEAQEIPCVWGFLQPFSRTAAFSSALLPVRLSLGPALNRLSHRLVELVTWLTWRSQINRWRVNELGLPPASWGAPFECLYREPGPVLYAFSPQVLAAPADWPAWHRVTGYWFLDEQQDWNPPQALEQFLQAGPAPVYVGFGSPGTRCPEEAVVLVLRALEQLGQRAVFSLPHELQAAVRLPAFVFPLAAASHTWLFPRMLAVLHHGGAGTTAAGLRAGVPNLVLPLAIDQFFWGERLKALGVSPQPLPQRRLAVRSLAAALHQAVSDPDMRQRAAALGKAIRGEDGVAAAVEIVTKFV